MLAPKIVSRDEWTTAREQLLAKEKEHLHRRDALSAERRALPCVKVEKDYVFAGPSGATSLRDLFAGRRQLVVYHFMFDTDWQQGCKSCSLLADTFDGGSLHLPARDVSFVAVSRAPLAKLEAFKKRMGWSFAWVSSAGSDFNRDYHVSFRQEDRGAGTQEYNYQLQDFPATEAPGVSVFLRDGDDVLHTYSTYGRGLDSLISTYQYLDLTPFGRNEEALSNKMSWVRHHDRYETDAAPDRIDTGSRDQRSAST
jgi:predicted dithiol-disulfide oxidoreductase (DUF899 family)